MLQIHLEISEENDLNATCLPLAPLLVEPMLNDFVSSRSSSSPRGDLECSRRANLPNKYASQMIPDTIFSFPTLTRLTYQALQFRLPYH
jgi:hypothetical protein